MILSTSTLVSDLPSQSGAPAMPGGGMGGMGGGMGGMDF